jgi:hypothetical protein
MRRLRAPAILALHVWSVWRAGQLRFRMETFGLYYPALPYTVSWWRIPPSNLALFLQRAGVYARWAVDMDEIHRGGVEASSHARHVSVEWLRTQDPR